MKIIKIKNKNFIVGLSWYALMSDNTNDKKNEIKDLSLEENNSCHGAVISDIRSNDIVGFLPCKLSDIDIIGFYSLAGSIANYATNDLIVIQSLDNFETVEPKKIKEKDCFEEKKDDEQDNNDIHDDIYKGQKFWVCYVRNKVVVSNSDKLLTETEVKEWLGGIFLDDPNLSFAGKDVQYFIPASLSTKIISNSEKEFLNEVIEEPVRIKRICGINHFIYYFGAIIGIYVLYLFLSSFFFEKDESNQIIEKVKPVQIQEMQKKKIEEEKKKLKAEKQKVEKSILSNFSTLRYNDLTAYNVTLNFLETLPVFSSGWELNKINCNYRGVCVTKWLAISPNNGDGLIKKLNIDRKDGIPSIDGEVFQVKLYNKKYKLNKDNIDPLIYLKKLKEPIDFTRNFLQILIDFKKENPESNLKWFLDEKSGNIFLISGEAKKFGYNKKYQIYRFGISGTGLKSFKKIKEIIFKTGISVLSIEVLIDLKDGLKWKMNVYKISKTLE